LVGYKAVLQADHNPTNTLYDAKRFIGKQFTVDELNSEASHYPFKVIFLLSLLAGVHYLFPLTVFAPPCVSTVHLSILMLVVENVMSLIRIYIQYFFVIIYIYIYIYICIYR